MSALPQTVQETIAGWLSSGQIEVFIGYEVGTVPLRATPAFVRKVEDVGRLIWDATCENNLVAFLPKYRGKKVGVLVKGCDARAIVGLMQEGQLLRENLRIVGVCCSGVVDVRHVAERLAMAPDDIEEGHVAGGKVFVGERTVSMSEVLFDICGACAQHNPEFYDVLLGEPVPGVSAEAVFAQVREMDALDQEERWARFELEVRHCNLCYACRNACPLCYCTRCFADNTMPRWFNQTALPEDIQFFQTIRTFHLAGRCVGCGACTRACPQGVNLRLLLDKLRLESIELYGYEAGKDPGAKPPLTVYRENDYNDFVL